MPDGSEKRYYPDKNSNTDGTGKKYYGGEEDDFYYKNDKQQYGNSGDSKKYYGDGSYGGQQSDPPQQYPQQNKTYKKVPSGGRKRRGNWKKGIGILILAGLLIAIFFSPLYSDLSNLWGGPVYPEKAEFTIDRTISLTSNREIEYNVELPVPQDISGNDIQYIQDIDWGDSTDLSTIQKFGQEWKNWQGTLPGGSTSFDITYHVKTKTVDWGYGSDKSGTVDDISQELKDTYNRNQWQLDEDRDGDGQNDWMIQPDNPEIRDLAEDIVKNEDNVYDKARAIYDWLNKNIDYQRGSRGLPKHALWVLDSGSGDCDEQSFLYCSLSRAVGIPAWIELGVLYDRVIDEWGGHGWIRLEFVNDEGSTGWVNIDPVNNQFFARDATRFTSWVDDGVQGHLEDYYMFLNYSYQNVGDPPQVSISEDMENVDMETEGQVVLGDGDSIPGFTNILLIPAIIISIILYRKRKR